jgi:hypothetical protein
MLILPLLLYSVLSNFVAADTSVYPRVAQAAVQEFDLYLSDWRKGMAIRLHHPVFALTYVSGGAVPDVISFKGESFGEPGEISLQFFTMEGDVMQMPNGQASVARVDGQRREFVVSAVIPRVLRGRTGVVQVTFAGAKRAAFLLKVEL